MLVPVEWLREYTSFDIPDEELADRLTMSGLEVEEIVEVERRKVFSTYVTPNRPDLLSITGVAREVAALLATDFRLPATALSEGHVDAGSLARVDIESPVNCPRYSARVLTDVRVVESPAWMQERLIAGGLRPINNVVDATNYVLLELGQPLHAFDYDLITDHHIVVRQARPGEKIVAIDGEERELTPDMLVIADPKRAVAIAGVMGGLDSEVGSRTRNVLLESAHFNRLSIRRTARALQMNTEASYRFERWVDPQMTVYALDRVSELIVASGGGSVAKGVVDCYPGRVEPIKVSIRPQRASLLLGLDVSADQISDYLTRLGMQTSPPKEDGIEVTVPTFRPDIQREEDLIEEVGRLYGYDRVPATLPRGETMQGKDSEEGRLCGRIAGILISAGLQEVVTGSMSPQYGEAQVAIRNPISDELSRLRDNLALDLLNVVSYNGARGIRDIGIFEIGRVFAPQKGNSSVAEKISVAGAMTGSIWGPTWNTDRSSLAVDFFLCKGIVEEMLRRLGVRDVTYAKTDTDWLHPTRAAAVMAGGDRVGVLGQVNSDLAHRFDVPGETYVFELDLDELTSRAGRAVSYVPLSRYPAVTRDLAVVVPEDVPYAKVEELLVSGAGDLVESLSLFDLYRGAPLPSGHKSLAFTIVFRSRERTLRDEEVDGRLSEARNLLSAELGASFRET